jgi:uncharacterized protein (DUF2225 family)
MLKYYSLTNLLTTEVMMASAYLYDKKAICPACQREFTITKVRTSHLKVKEQSRDFYTNFYTKYKG